MIQKLQDALAAAKVVPCASERDDATIKKLLEELAAAGNRDSRQRTNISDRDDLIRKLEVELSESWKMNERKNEESQQLVVAISDLRKLVAATVAIKSDQSTVITDLQKAVDVFTPGLRLAHQTDSPSCRGEL